MMFDFFLWLAMCLLAVSMLFLLYRVVKGPTISDRVLALDTMSYIIIGLVAVLSIQFDTNAFLETILLIGILAFLSTIALCRFIERGVVIARKRVD